MAACARRNDSRARSTPRQPASPVPDATWMCVRTGRGEKGNEFPCIYGLHVVNMKYCAARVLFFPPLIPDELRISKTRSSASAGARPDAIESGGARPDGRFPTPAKARGPSVSRQVIGRQGQGHMSGVLVVSRGATIQRTIAAGARACMQNDEQGRLPCSASTTRCAFTPAKPQMDDGTEFHHGQPIGHPNNATIVMPKRQWASVLVSSAARDTHSPLRARGSGIFE